MVILLKIIFIIFIISPLTFSKESYSNFEEDLILHNSSQNSSDNSSDIPSNKSSDEIPLNNFQLFPIAYLSYIIKGFLPKFNGSNDFLVAKLLGSECFTRYRREYNEKNTDSLFKTIRYSGKSYPDYGDEEGCIGKDDEKDIFMLFSIYFDVDQGYGGKYKLLPFVKEGYSFYGLCIQKSCEEELLGFIQNDFNNDSLMNESYHLDAFIHAPKEENNIKYKTRRIIYRILFYLIIAFMAARLIVGLFGLNFFKEDDLDKKKKNSGSSSSSSSDDEEEEEEEDDDDNKKKNKQKKIEEEAKKQLLVEKKEKIIPKKDLYPKLFIIYKFCSIKTSFKNLVKRSGGLFEEKDLYLIIFFKVFSLLLKTLYMNIYLMTLTPSKELNNVDFFDNFLMVLIKYASFSDIIFILTESIIVAYKLMSFIRKYTNRNEEPSINLFINFFLRIIPSFVSTFLFFLIFYFLSEAMMDFLMEKSLFERTRMQHFRKDLINCYSCMEKAQNLIPFYMQYQNFNKILFDSKDCFPFMIILVNMFYCYIFVIILTYISYKIKNIKCDYIFAILFGIYYIIPNNILCKAFQNEYFNSKFLFGETYSTKYTHLFINYYFLGFLIGLSIFYNNDITNENSLHNSNIYKPFYFLQDIIGFIFLKSFWTKILIILLTIIVQFLLSLIFFVYSRFDLESNLEKEMNDFDHFIYLNEKSVFALFFGLFLIVLYTFKNEAIIKGLCNNIAVIIFNRIAHGYYALIEIMINYMLCFIELEVQLNITNIVFLTFGIIFYIMALNILLIVCFEIPIKILVKKLLSLKSDEKVKLLD